MNMIELFCNIMFAIFLFVSSVTMIVLSIVLIGMLRE